MIGRSFKSRYLSRIEKLPSTDHLFTHKVVYMKHHTKDKGDLGLGFVVSDLLRQGVQPALLLSEHLPFDCIAVSIEGNLCKLFVKYRAAKNGMIFVDLRSSWADSKGTHTKEPDLTLIDAVAVFCPDTSLVYYVRADEIHKNSFTLRINIPKNNQMSGVRLADNYRDVKRIFAPIA